MSKDIRSFFGAAKGNSQNNKPPSAQKNPPITSNQSSGKKDVDVGRDNDERKRKAGV